MANEIACLKFNLSGVGYLWDDCKTKNTLPRVYFFFLKRIFLFLPFSPGEKLLFTITQLPHSMSTCLKVKGFMPSRKTEGNGQVNNGTRSFSWDILGRSCFACLESKRQISSF